MKTRFVQFVWAVCLMFASERGGRSQSSTYFDFGNFYNACQPVPGNKQSISYFLSSGGGLIGPTLTISDVTFTGRYLIRAQFNAGPALYNFDSGVPLGIHFANGARAFGGDFSSFAPQLVSSFTATLSLDNGETVTFTAPTNPNSRFFGFISPTPMGDMTFSGGGLYFGLHEELIGNLYMVTVIPEASTLALFGLGGFFVCYAAASQAIDRWLRGTVSAPTQRRWQIHQSSWSQAFDSQECLRAISARPRATPNPASRKASALGKQS